jgi:hypothetical protein
MFIVLFAIDVEPFGGGRIIHFLFCDFGGLIIVEGMGIFIPGAGIDLDEERLLFLFKCLHRNYIVICYLSHQSIMQLKLGAI